MALSLTRIGAVLRYEFLIQWRQRVALLSSVVVCVLCVLLMLALQGNSRLSQFVASDVAKTMTPGQLDEANRQLSTVVILSLYSLLHFFSLLLFPIILADVFPKDKQYGVRELIDTLPLSSGDYLTGKLAGTLGNVLMALALPMIVVAIGWWVLVYPYDVSAYLGMWIVALFPIGCLNTALCALIASAQPTRRRAILIGIVFAVASLLMLSFGLGTETGLLDYFNLSRPLPFKYYIISMSGGVMQSYGYVPVPPVDVLLTIAAGVLEIAVVGLFVQRWLMRRQTR